MHQSNPLASYIRKPVIFIKLPSEGKWWPAGSIKIPENGELPVMAMTGNDEIMLKTADGLINGSSTVDVIQSCIPNIKNAWEMPTVDVDYLFIAIRIASYGNEMEIEKTCANCGELSPYSINLSYFLENYRVAAWDTPVQLDDLLINFKPTAYKVTNLLSQEIFEQQRIMLAANSETLTYEQKKQIAEDSIRKLSKITVDRLAEYISCITMPDGTKVTEKNYIDEFIKQADRKTFKVIQKNIDERSAFKSIPDMQITCDKCGESNTTSIEFDPANFFEADS